MTNIQIEAVKFLLSQHTQGQHVSEPAISRGKNAQALIDALDKESQAQAQVAALEASMPVVSVPPVPPVPPKV